MLVVDQVLMQFFSRNPIYFLLKYDKNQEIRVTIKHLCMLPAGMFHWFIVASWRRLQCCLVCKINVKKKAGKGLSVTSIYRGEYGLPTL